MHANMSRVGQINIKVPGLDCSTAQLEAQKRWRERQKKRAQVCVDREAWSCYGCNSKGTHPEGYVIPCLPAGP
jgi:hypothetical protein